MSTSQSPGLPGSDLPVGDVSLGAQAVHQVADGGPLVDGAPRAGRLGLEGVDEAPQARPVLAWRPGSGPGKRGEDRREGRSEEPLAGPVAPRPAADGDEETGPYVRGEELVDRFSREDREVLPDRQRSGPSP